jgi:hypothetical protein
MTPKLGLGIRGGFDSAVLHLSLHYGFDIAMIVTGETITFNDFL